MTSVQVNLAYSAILLLCLFELSAVSGSGYGWNPSGQRVVTRVQYNEPQEKHIHVTHEVHHVVHRKRPARRRKIVPVIEEHVVQPVHVAPIDHVAGVNHGGYGVGTLEGSYVAVSGTPGHGSVHVVEDVPALGSDSVLVVNGHRIRSKGHRVAVNLNPVVVEPEPVAVPPPVAHPSLIGGHVPVLPSTQHIPIRTDRRPDGVAGDRLPLPKCSYINTDFPGDDLYNDYDGDDNDDDNRRRRGVNAGSARACKALCRLDDDCSFWTYREGFNRDTNVRDCFLKQGTPGLPVPREAVPRIGFVSGTKDNNCVCIMSDDEEDEVCPLKNPKGLVYPWRSTDQEEDDLARGLLPSGWNRVGGSAYYPGLTGGDGGLADEVRRLRDQIDDLQSQLDNS